MCLRRSGVRSADSEDPVAWPASLVAWVVFVAVCGQEVSERPAGVGGEQVNGLFRVVVDRGF